MTDYTSEIVRLQRARLDMQTAKKTAEINVKERYAKKIRDEIKYETEQAELEFARALKEAHDRGVPSSLLRSEVLRTNVWNRWTYWRDLAMIEPDRVVVQNVREAKERAEIEARGMIWNDDFTVLTVTKSITGLDLTEPVRYALEGNYRRFDKYWPQPHSVKAEDAAIEENKNTAAYINAIDAEITAQIQAGNVPDPSK